MSLPSPFRALVRVALLAAALAGAAGAHAQAQLIQASTTNLTSTSQRMISYRAQEHSWQTADGHVHLMRNVGRTPSGESLVLATSFDGGRSWTDRLALAGTDEESTSDGQLSGNTLAVTYATAGPAAQVRRAILAYDNTSKAWRLTRTETVFARAGVHAMNPAVAADGQGNLWAAFTVRDLASGAYSIRMAQRPAGAGAAWVDTGLVFGTPGDATSPYPFRGARPVPVPGGVGMVFKVNQVYHWATRSDGMPVTQPWTTAPLYTSQTPDDKDPYASHFSVVADRKSRNLFLALVDAGQLVVMRNLALQPGWTTMTRTADLQAAYPQLTLADGNVIVMVNEQAQIRVMQSSNQGRSFTLTHRLVHAADGADYGNPRIEAPSYATGTVPTLQQYVDQGVQRLLFFPVPVVR